jgi:hypothetical protein
MTIVVMWRCSAGVKFWPPGGAHVTGGRWTGPEARADGTQQSAHANAKASPRLTTAHTL